MRELWDHQQRAMDKLRESLIVKKTRPVLQASTGWGKTVVASKIIESARAKNRRVWFTVPSVDLVDQTVRLLWDEGVRDIGVKQASHEMTDHSKPVQVVSVQTLDKLDLDALTKPDLILVDECHRMFAVIKRIIEEWLEVPVIGLSATPWSKGLGRYYDSLIISATTTDLIRMGRLSPFRVFAPSHPDTSGVKTSMTAHGKDFAEGELSEVMQGGSLTADIVSTWLQRARDRGKTLVYGVDRAHAMSLHKQFERAGVRSIYQDGGTPKHEREDIRLGFASGRYEVVCNIATLTTGIDWDVRCIVLARPTKSEILYTQIIGRGLRTADGKDDLLILDHSDTTLNLGFVTDIRHDKLDDGTPAKTGTSKEPEPRKPRECPQCEMLFPKFARACPGCGFEPTLQAREIETMEGELVELDGNKRNKKTDWPEKIAFIRGLRAYQIEKGMKHGWVGWKYETRFGVFPNDPRVKYAPPAAECDPYIRRWIKAQNIRWAKEREQAE